MIRTTTLFSKGDLRDAKTAHFEKIEDEVNAIPEDRFLKTPEERLVEHVTQKMEIHPLELHEESKTMEREETEVEVPPGPLRRKRGRGGPVKKPGTRVTVKIPWTGDRDLWDLCPSSRRMSGMPEGRVRRAASQKPGTLELVIEKPEGTDPEEYEQALESQLDDIRFYVDAQADDLEGVNEEVEKRVRSAVSRRKERLQEQDEIADALGIPLEEDENAPDVDPIDVERKTVRPLPDEKGGGDPEPGIREEDYEHILKVIRHEGRTFESTPGTYQAHDEEGLRDILLAHLNGHYEGQATGETFRKKGKTDIRIEDGERAAFVAECKVWRGPQSAEDAVDQLLGYLTWRDCKAALVIFNKENRNFSRIQDKLPNTLEDHPRFIKWEQCDEQGEWRAKFHSANDDDRTIRVQVFTFNVFVEE